MIANIVYYRLPLSLSLSALIAGCLQVSYCTLTACIVVRSPASLPTSC